MTGEVMYHKFIQRTPEEIKALKEKIKAKRFVSISLLQYILLFSYTVIVRLLKLSYLLSI